MNNLDYLGELKELIDLATKQELAAVLYDLGKDLPKAAQFLLIEALKDARNPQNNTAGSIASKTHELEKKWAAVSNAELKLEAEPVYGEDLLVDAPERFILTDDQNVSGLIQESEALIHEAINARDFNTAFKLMALLHDTPLSLTFMDAKVDADHVLSVLERHGLVDEKLENIWLEMLPVYFTQSNDSAETILENTYNSANTFGFSLTILRPLFEAYDFSPVERQNIARSWKSCLVEHNAQQTTDGQEALAQAESHLPELYSDLL